MAKQRQPNNKAIVERLLLLFIVGAIVILINLFVINQQTRTPPMHNIENIKLMQSKTVSKLIKVDSNTVYLIFTFQILIIRVEEAIKMAPKLFGENNNGIPISIQSFDPNDKNCPINNEIIEMNKKLMDWINNPPDSPLCQIKNFHSVPVKKLIPIEQGDLQNLPIFHEVKKLAQKLPSKLEHGLTLEPSIKFEDVNLDHTKLEEWKEYDIDEIISDSIVDTDHYSSDLAICNLIQTELDNKVCEDKDQWVVLVDDSEVDLQISNSNVSTKYLLIYIVFNIPIIVIIMTCTPNSNNKTPSTNKLISDSLNSPYISKDYNILTELGEHFDANSGFPSDKSMLQ